MTKADYLDLRQQLRFEPVPWMPLGVLAFDVMLAGVAIWLVAPGRGPGYWLGQALLAVFYFHNFALLHECGHGNSFRQEKLNSLVGHYASLFCFLPYFPWKYMHHEHHTWTGNIDKDPTLTKIRRMRLDGEVPVVVRIAWWSWIPVAGLLQHFVFWGYPFKSWREGRTKRPQLLRSAFSVLLLVVTYTIWATYAPAAISASNIWPSFLFYLVGVELVNLPHHVGMPTFKDSVNRHKLYLWEQHVSTRSCFYPGLISELFVLNFNLHTEHHFFPTLPWYRLKRAREVLKPTLMEGYHEEVGIEWNLKNRIRDPREIILGP